MDEQVRKNEDGRTRMEEHIRKNEDGRTCMKKDNERTNMEELGWKNNVLENQDERRRMEE